MTKLKWQDADLDRHLRSLSAETAVAGAPEVSASLLTRTRARLAKRRPQARVRLLPVAAAALVALLMVPATMVAMGQPILGIRVSISDMDPAEWLRQGFSGWLASPEAPAFLSPEETAQVASFPIRVPTWLPEGYEAVSEPQGAYRDTYQGGRWRTSQDPAKFFVSQSFQLGDDPTQRDLAVLQTLRPVPTKELTLAPGTQMLEIQGHPAFLKLDVPLAKADKASEENARLGQLPEITDHVNMLEVWVEEANGQITELIILGGHPPEVLVQVAESLLAE